MSFNDMNSLEAQPASSNYTDVVTGSPEFKTLSDRISREIYSIVSNVSTTHRYIRDIGTTRDSPKNHASLNDILPKTIQMMNNLMPDIKRLNNSREIGPNE